MIILQMSGGLGNQMFQYALYLRLRSLGREVCFDDRTQYDEETFRNSEQKRRPKRLNVFGISYPAAAQEDIVRMTDAAMDPVSRVRRKLTGRKSLEKRDQDFIFDPSFLETEEGYFCGNFQSPKYWEPVADEVRRAFAFPEGLLTPAEDASRAERRILMQAEKTAQRIREANEGYDRRMRESGPVSGKGTPASAGGSASIHLRFGDYVSKPEIYGGICTDAYYNEGIRKLRAMDPEITFFVFSNDPERAGAWVSIQAQKEENLGRSRFVLVQGSDEDHGYLDLWLMTLCRGHIIANSSFSWWGAWLCAEPGRTVFAPSVWNNEPDGSELRRTDIYASFMRRISPNGKEITENPMVSVIMAAYNVAPYVERAVDSVLNQTYRNLELIAVDDGSTDETGTILEACAARDRRVRVLHRENGGVSAARNDGIAVSQGEYIGFVDGDDTAHPEMYEALVRGIMESGSDMGAVNYREVYTDGGTGAEDTGSAGTIREIVRRGTVMSRERALRTFIRSGVEGAYLGIEMHHSVWTKLYSRRLLKDNRFVEGSSAEDIYFTTSAMCHSGRVLYLPDVMYDYLKDRSGSNMNIGRARRTLEEELPAWDAHRKMVREYAGDVLAEESEYCYYRRLLYYIEQYGREPQTKEQAKELRRILLEAGDRVRELARRPDFGRRGDRLRLRLFVASPAVYSVLSRLYEGTAVRLRSGRSARAEDR